MPKISDQQLSEMKRMQDAYDDDEETDIAKRHKFVHEHSKEKGNRGNEGSDETESGADTKKDTRNLLIVIGIFVLIFAIFFIVAIIRKPERQTMTIDEMHAANLQGELDPKQGYIYHGYSFVNMGGIWYSQIQKGNTTYDITFNNDPRGVENITVQGNLSKRFAQDDIFITFDTDSGSLPYVTVANAGLSMSLAKGFKYNLTASCTSNHTACLKNGIVTCGDTDKAVIYFKEDPETKITLFDNCVTVQGTGPEIVRAKDRLLLRWYGVLD
jgi:hypothetical protein